MSGVNIWDEEPNFTITDFDQTGNNLETHPDTINSFSILEDDFEFSNLNFTFNEHKLANHVNSIPGNDVKNSCKIEKNQFTPSTTLAKETSTKNCVILEDSTSAESVPTNSVNDFIPVKLNFEDKLKNTEYSFSKLLGGNEPKSQDFIRKFVEGRIACFVEKAKQKYSKSCSNLIQLNDSQHLLLDHPQDNYDGNHSKSCEDLDSTFDKNGPPFMSINAVLSKKDNQYAPLNSTFNKGDEFAPLNSTFNKDDKEFVQFNSNFNKNDKPFLALNSTFNKDAPLNLTFSKDDKPFVLLNTTYDKDAHGLELHSTFNKAAEACNSQGTEIKFTNNTFTQSSHFSKSIEVLNIYGIEKKKESSESAPGGNETYEIKDSNNLNASHIMKKSFSCTGLTQLNSKNDNKGHLGKHDSLFDVDMKFEESLPSEDEKDEFGLPVLKKVDLSFYEVSRVEKRKDAEISHIIQKYNIMRTSFCEPNDEDGGVDVENEEQLHAKTELVPVKEPLLPNFHGAETPPKHVDRNKPKTKGPMKALPPLQNMAKNLTEKFMSPFTKNKAKDLPSSHINTSHALYESFDESVQIPVAASTPSSGVGHASRRESGGMNKRRSLSTGATPRKSYEPVQDVPNNLSYVPAVDSGKNSTFTSNKPSTRSGIKQINPPVKENVGLRRPSTAPSQPTLKAPLHKMLPARSQNNIPTSSLVKNSSVYADQTARNLSLNPIKNSITNPLRTTINNPTRNAAAPRSSLIGKTLINPRQSTIGRQSTLPKTAANSTMSKSSVPLKPSSQVNTTSSSVNTSLKRPRMIASKLRSLTGFGKENKK